LLKRLKATTLYKKTLRRALWSSVGAYRLIADFVYDTRCDVVFSRIAAHEVPLLEAARLQYEAEYEGGGDPLVTIYIPTYNRGSLLVERTLPTALNQTYKNLEILIVGDHCTDNTAELVAQIDDPRVRFYNKPERGPYPRYPKARYKVGGVPPINVAMRMAQGKWIAHLDDDDLLTPDHVEVMLRHAQEHNLEFVFGRTKKEVSPGEWIEEGGTYLPTGHRPFRRRKTRTSHTAIMYRAYLRLFEYSLHSWRLNLGADTHRYMRLSRAGVRSGHIHEVVAMLPLRPGETQRGRLIQEIAQ
jgi:hypothetical protein